MSFEVACDLGGKGVAVHSERAASRELGLVTGLHNDRVCAAHLFMQEPDCIRFPLVGAEGVRADKLGQAIGLVGVGHALRTHFMQYDGDAGMGDLPGRFAARQSAANHMNGRQSVRGLCHNASLWHARHGRVIPGSAATLSQVEDARVWPVRPGLPVFRRRRPRLISGDRTASPRRPTRPLCRHTQSWRSD